MHKLYIVSCGPGGSSYLTSQAINAIKDAEVVISYSKYARELESLLMDKELITSGMTHEIQRCVEAVEEALKGKTTAIISNGDSNVFGIASIIYELLETKDLENKIEIINIAGVTSFLAVASKVGAPINEDFAIISLSDRLKDAQLINKKVNNSLEADFILGIYNPKSKKRTQSYINFLQSLKNHEERVVIIASNVGRQEKEQISITNTTALIDKGLEHELVGMATLLIIGNSNTKISKNGYVLSPDVKLSKESL